jgi:branched-chain amino acid aminotransferase
MKILIYVQNKWQKPGNAKISILDRSVLFGDSIFETLRTFDQSLWMFDEHFARLKQSSKLSGISIPPSKNKIQKLINSGIAKIKSKHELRIRLVVTRGQNEVTLAPPQKAKPQLFIVISEIKPLARPLKVLISSYERVSNKAIPSIIKSGNYFNQILALKDAQAKGFDDAIFLNTKGEVAEATTSNVFCVKKNILYTPPLESGLLAGTIRKRVIQAAGQLKIKVIEKSFKADFLLKADEIFLTNSVQIIMPVGQINKRKLKSYEVTERLKVMLVSSSNVAS